MPESLTNLEYWLRGPIDGVPALLQPVVHALLQAREEINGLLKEFDAAKLWEQPKEMASAGFHLQHIAGVLDRLFTYARGEALSNKQLKYLSGEGLEDDRITVSDLLSQLSNQVDSSIEFLKTVDVNTLTEFRGVGRKNLPSTVIGLLFHSAEHTMRHAGQLRVTVGVVG